MKYFPSIPFRKILLSLGASAIFLLAVWFLGPYCVSLPEHFEENPDSSPLLTDRNGQPISRLFLPGAPRNTPVTAEELPADLLACTLAAEDKRFYEHHGVDLLSTARAARDLILKRRITSGASTITQQLIKISSPPTKRSFSRKIYEALAARKLEKQWTKQQILTTYLNRLDYGNQCIGAAEAARFYFQKPLADLSLAENALLAGLPQAPSRLNPLRHPRRALIRRSTVLLRLATTAPSTRIPSAIAEPLNLRPLRESRLAPWLAFLTPPQEIEHRSTQKIPTTLDLSLQKDIETIVREETAKLKSANLRHASVVVIHNPTGEILTLVSSADWTDPRGGQFNGALLPRSPGSTLKPFTYLLALEQNHRTPASILSDIPSPFLTPQGLNLPENYDHAYRGPVTLRTALSCSLNIPAIRELNLLGGSAPLYSLLKTLGISTLKNPPEFYGLGLTIGNAPVCLLQLTNAYSTLARNGLYIPARLFSEKIQPSPTPLPFSPISFYLLADILSDSAARAPSFPPGGPLDLPFCCAVKTGTSSDFRDNWCIGYTPEFTVGVWAGNFENQPMKQISGITGAGPIFHRTMLRLHRNHSPSWFEKPAAITAITIDKRNGKLISETQNTSPYLIRDLAPSQEIPPSASSADYDSSGKALLDPSYTTWFTSPHNQRSAELALNPQPLILEPLKIITPTNDATFLLDPEIPSGSAKLRPITNLPGTAHWSSPTLEITPSTPEPTIHLIPGTHTLTATDPRTGHSQNITLHIKNI